MSTTDRVIFIINQYPSMTLKNISDYVGVSKQRVSEILKIHGIQTVFAKKWTAKENKNHCRLCNRKIPYGYKYCAPCHEIHYKKSYKCAECGKTINRLKSHETWREVNRNKKLHFCDNVCKGAFAGKHWGFVAHPSNRFHKSEVTK